MGQIYLWSPGKNSKTYLVEKTSCRIIDYDIILIRYLLKKALYTSWYIIAHTSGCENLENNVDDYIQTDDQGYLWKEEWNWRLRDTKRN